MVAHKIAPAIATNNCMVCKPTEQTPLTAITLADILYEAGLPPEMFQVVTGWPADIGDEMITNPNINIITFTGGVPVGKIIAEKAGYRRTALELGGNDPLIILNDLRGADLEKAATIAVAGATGNSGQRCTAVKRILVQESVADELVPHILENGDPWRSNERRHATWLVINAEAAALFENRVLRLRNGRRSSITRDVKVRCCANCYRPRATRQRTGDGGNLRAYRSNRSRP